MRNDVGKRARTAGGCGNSDAVAGTAGQSQEGGGRRREPRPREHRKAADVGRTGRAERVEQPVGELLEGGLAPLLLLWNQVHRAELQRADRAGGAGPGIGADHHDGPRRFRHDVADRRQPVELRHLEIHEHEIGLPLVQLAERDHAVACGRGHAKLSAAGHHVADQPAKERAVVDDEHARRLRGGGCHASPR
jgi:hypothetical protein